MGQQWWIGGYLPHLIGEVSGYVSNSGGYLVGMFRTSER